MHIKVNTMKSKFYFLAVAVIMAAVFSGCKEKEEPELEWSVSTQPASEVTINSARLVGMTSTTEMEVTELGFYYDTTRDMYGQMKASATDGFSAIITDLAANTTYYYYAYATAYGKTKQGDVKMFKTLAPNAPIVETLEATDVTLTSATINGNVTSDGGSNVKTRGFYYGTNQGELTQNITSGRGTGSFSTQLYSLTQGTRYYYKAYAVNSVDTTYGEVKFFDMPAAINGHEYVDLGLPSGKLWATCNVGASSPTGEGGAYTYTNVTWGGGWTMPTRADFQELIGTCSYVRTTENEGVGYRFTGPNGRSIFMPCGGYWSSTSDHYQDYYHYYLNLPSYSSGVNIDYVSNNTNKIRPIHPAQN